MVTKFFSRMFDAVQNDEDELLKQVQKDLDTAKAEGSVDTSQITYKKTPQEGVIEVVDKVNNETTKVTPTDEGYLMQSDEQSYLLPQIAAAVEDLKATVEELKDGSKENKESPEVPVEAPNSAENTNASEGKPSGEVSAQAEGEKVEKQQSATQPDQKVVLTIDGEVVTGYQMEDMDGGKVKVRIPSMDNAFIVVPKSSVQIPQKETVEKVTTDQYKTFSVAKKTKKFSIAKKQRSFSVGGDSFVAAISVDDSTYTPYSTLNENFEGSNIRVLKGGFKTKYDADKWINDNPKEVQKIIKSLLPVAKTFSVAKKVKSFSPKTEMRNLVELTDDGKSVRVEKKFNSYKEAIQFLKKNPGFSKRVDEGTIDLWSDEMLPTK